MGQAKRRVGTQAQDPTTYASLWVRSGLATLHFRARRSAERARQSTTSRPAQASTDHLFRSTHRRIRRVFRPCSAADRAASPTTNPIQMSGPGTTSPYPVGRESPFAKAPRLAEGLMLGRIHRGHRLDRRTSSGYACPLHRRSLPGDRHSATCKTKSGKWYRSDRGASHTRARAATLWVQEHIRPNWTRFDPKMVARRGGGTSPGVARHGAPTRAQAREAARLAWHLARKLSMRVAPAKPKASHRARRPSAGLLSTRAARASRANTRRRDLAQGHTT